MPHRATNTRLFVEIAMVLQLLACMQASPRSEPLFHLRRKSTLPRALNRALRFPQGSNINSNDKSCGKPKAARSHEFPCGKTRFFQGELVTTSFAARPALKSGTGGLELEQPASG